MVAACLLVALFAPLAAMCVPPAPPAHDCCPTEQTPTAPAGNCCTMGTPQRPEMPGLTLVTGFAAATTSIHHDFALVAVATPHFEQPAAPDTSPPGCSSVLRI